MYFVISEVKYKGFQKLKGAKREEEEEKVKLELVFIPYPIIGHLKSTVEMAKLLVEQETKLSISIIILPFMSGDEVAVSAYISSLSAVSNDRLR